MYTIKLKSYPHHDNESIIIVRPTNYNFETGEIFSFIEYGTNEHLYNKVLVSKRTVEFKDLTAEISYLDKGVSLDLYKEILKTNFSYLSKDILECGFDVLVFTDTLNIIPEQTNSEIHYINKGTTPKSKLISKDYYFDSSKDYAQRENCPVCEKNKLKTKLEIQANQCFDCFNTVTNP